MRRRRRLWSFLGSSCSSSSSVVVVKIAKIFLVVCLLAASFTQYLTLRAFKSVRDDNNAKKKILDVHDYSARLRPPSRSRRVGDGGVNVGSGTDYGDGGDDDEKDGDDRKKQLEEEGEGFELPVRAFPKFDHPFPCVVGRGRGGTDGRGLFYIKTPKCASSTLAGIARRMAIRNHPANYVNSVNGTVVVPSTDIRQSCRVHSRHRPAYKIPDLVDGRKQHDGNNSYLFTFVRDPTSRFVSDFYHFEVSRNGVKPTDDALIDYVNGGYARNHRCCGHFAHGLGGFQFPYLLLPGRRPSSAGAGAGSSHLPVAPHTFWHPDRPDEVRNRTHLVRSVVSILRSYDFIGTVERLDESLVAMSFLLFGCLRVDHILYLPSKVSGGYDDGKFRNTCHLIRRPTPGSLSPGSTVGSYLASAEWRARIAGDEMLHEAVDASLDKTIDDVIGRDVFNVALGEFRSVLRSAGDRCTNETVRFPCRWDGTRNDVTDCYDGDEGCGHECLDRVYDSFATTTTADAAPPSA